MTKEMNTNNKSMETFFREDQRQELDYVTNFVLSLTNKGEKDFYSFIMGINFARTMMCEK